MSTRDIFITEFLKAPEVIRAEYISSIPKYLLDQISDKDSTMVDYTVKDHGKPFHGSFILPNVILDQLLNNVPNAKKAVRALIDGLIICSCPEGESRPTSCVVNQLFSYQGDPVNYFDPKLWRAVRIQGIDPASWEMPLPMFQLVEKIKQLRNVIYVNSEPHYSQEAKEKFRSDMPIAIHVGWVDNSGKVPEPSVPISIVVPHYVYMNADNHHLVIDEVYDWIQKRLENLT